MYLRPVIALVFLFFNHPSHGHESIIWGFSEFKPFIYEDGYGNVQGIFAEMMEPVFKKANIEYTAFQNPNRRSKMLMEDGRFNFTIVPAFVIQHPENYLIGNETVTIVEMHAFWVGDKKPIKDIPQLRGHSVALITGFTYAGARAFIESPGSGVSISVDVEDHKRALKALSLGRADYMLGYKKPADNALKNMTISNLNSSILGKAKFRFVMHRSNYNADRIMQKIESAFREIYRK